MMENKDRTSASDNIAVRFEDFSFRYNSQKEPTLKNISLTIKKGEKVLVIGPSGSGKSTFGHCINGLAPHSYKGEVTGRLEVMGKEASQLGIFGLSRHVGTVLQDSDCQFIGLTVGEDIAFSMENECVDTDTMKQRVLSAAISVDMGSFLASNPFQLSGGQKQRVSLAGVMVNDVDILLFDEPLANLDPATGKYAIELIDDLQKQKGKTVIIIEHRLEDALHRGADRVILFDDGRIVADLPPSELLAGGLLKEHGIREPLFISALKMAGCSIKAEDNLNNIASLNIDAHKERLLGWTRSGTNHPVQVTGRELLSVRDLAFKYKSGTRAIKNISFSVKEGEMIAVIGKNGAGKSTLSKLICGMERPDSGSIIFEGRDITHDTIKERSLRIGFAMQNPNHMICKTMIMDEVSLGLKARKVADDIIKDKVERTLRICGLYPFRNWPVAALSYGQKKRVTIASVLVLEPKMLILDEPTAGQDYRHYTEIMEFLRELNERNGITILMITHDMHLAIEYTNRAIVLADGVKIADDTVAAVLSNEEAINSANLKKTSLYDLAVRLDMDPELLIQRFIEEEGVRYHA
jgi:energy-coupling factor transporter ATP-binding protein EcfA2